MSFIVELDKPLSFHQIGKRSNQEDARWPDTDFPDESTRVFAVCDGVGGRNKGEVASSTVARAIADFTATFSPLQPFTANDFRQLLMYIYKHLDLAATPDNAGMATTLTFLCFNRNGCFAAHMGDSRIYQARPGVGIVFRTQDHSLVNDLVHHGVITPDEVKDHPRRNVITRCLSPVTEDNPAQSPTTITLTDIKPGDVFMMCTDGVGECFTDEMLEEMLADEKATLLIKARNIASECALNSNDNNTAIFIRVRDVKEIDDEESVAPESFTNAPGDAPTVGLPPQHRTAVAEDIPMNLDDRQDGYLDGPTAVPPDADDDDDESFLLRCERKMMEMSDKMDSFVMKILKK